MAGEDGAARSATVLIVEDEMLVGLGLALALNVAGYRVVGPTGSMKRALALGAEHLPEIALVDIHLHGRPDGMAVASALAECHGSTVIFLTGAPEEAWQGRAFAFGVIAKPYDLVAIPEAIEAARRHRNGAPIGTVPRILEQFR